MNNAPSTQNTELALKVLDIAATLAESHLTSSHESKGEYNSKILLDFAMVVLDTLPQVQAALKERQLQN